MLMELKNRISLSASNDLWNLSKKWFPKIMASRQRDSITKKIPLFRSVRQNLSKTHVPNIFLEVAYEVKETGDIIVMSDMQSIPRKTFTPDKYTKLYEAATIKVNFPSVCQSVSPSVCPSVRPCVCVCVSVHAYLSGCACVCVSA